MTMVVFKLIEIIQDLKQQQMSSVNSNSLFDIFKLQIATKLIQEGDSFSHYQIKRLVG